MLTSRLLAHSFRRRFASSQAKMNLSGTRPGAGSQTAHSQQSMHSFAKQLAPCSRSLPISHQAPRAAAPFQTSWNHGTHTRFGANQRAFASAALEQETQEKQYLDLNGELDTDDDSLEDEFETEKGRRSLASLIGSDEDDLLEVDATMQDESLLVENCGLCAETVAALHARNVKSLFPIQKHVFDPAMAGRDLIGRAKTGSGKTLAFSLPVIEALIKANKEGGKRAPSGRAPRCIVLAPTRELAKQVEKEFASSAPSLELGCFYGGVDIGAQMRQLRRGLDVVVGTPGRVIDLLERNVLKLDEIKFFILDEADMMLSQGFDMDVERILENVPEERQTMLFSATMPSWVKRLTNKHLQRPVLVDLVGEASTGKLNEDITALAVQVEPSARRSVLVDVLTVYNAAGKAIIFTQTKRDADEVAAGVAQVMPCEALHGDMSQRDRERKLENFRKGKFSVLVATDVAARGLDIPNVDLVLHYELPRDTESFLHRSGRTARAGRTGTTIALFTRTETGLLRRIVKEVGVSNLEIMGPPGAKQVMEASAKQVLRRLDNVDDDVKAFFEPAAKLVMSQGDPQDAMCRALAAMSGLLEVPKPRSLLTQQEGFVTLRVTSRPGRIRSTGHIMTIVRNILGQDACDEVGRIRMLAATKADEKEGAAFDLPQELAEAFIARESELTSRDFAVDKPISLPLEEERRGGGNFRNDRRGGGDRRGGYGGGNRRGGYGGGGSGGYQSRGSSGGRGGYSGRGGGRNSGGSRGRSSYGNDSRGRSNSHNSW